MNAIVLGPSSRFNAEDSKETRSPSRSPNRRNHFTSHELDPLISNLSPTATLEALEATDALVSENRAVPDALQDSVAAASTSERSLGIRAALAGKKLKEWHKELMTWPWPTTSGDNGFRPPNQQEREGKGLEPEYDSYAHNRDRNQGFARAGNIDGEEYYGSIPAKLMEEYENRIEVIKDDMEALDLEALKEYVRDAHATSSTRSTLRRMHENDADTGYNHLDDFTAIITATIMQTLPIISHLISMLSVWSERLLVLRQVPAFLSHFDKARLSIKSAWRYLDRAEDNDQTHKELGITRAALLTVRTALEVEIFGLGRKLDNMLDILEGREDTIPEEWINDMESIETDFGDWVVESENQLLEGELEIHDGKSLAGFPKMIQNPLFEDTVGATSALEVLDPVFERSRESANTEGSPVPSPSFQSRSISPKPHQSEHKKSASHDLDAKEEHRNSFVTVFQESSASSGASHDSTFKEYAAPRFQNLASQSINGEGFQGFKVQNAGNGKPESSELQSLSADTYGVINKCSTVEQAQVSSHGESDFSSQQDRQKTDVVSESLTKPQPDINRFQEDRPNIFSNLVTQESFDSDSNDGNPEEPNEDTSDPSIINASVLHDSGTQISEHSKSKKPGAPRPAPLVLRHIRSNMESTPTSEMSSDNSRPGSGTSEYFSNLSSPEIQHASVAEYYDNPVEVSTPSRIPLTPLATISRQSSQRTERDESIIFKNGSPQASILPISSRRRSSTFAPTPNVSDMTEAANESPSHRAYLRSHLRVRSASLRSFEVIPRNEIRNITISRKGSYTSPASEPHISEFGQQSQIMLSSNNVYPSEEPLKEPKDRLQSLSQDSDNVEQTKLAQDSDAPINPEQNTTPKPSPQVPAKSRHRFESVSDLSPGSTPVKFRLRKMADLSSDTINNQQSMTQPSKSKTLRSSEDQLEARISSILTEIPGDIQLRSGPEPDAREVLPLDAVSGRKKSNVLTPPFKMIRARTSVSSPPLTLAPAHPKMSRSRTHVGEPEVKLYHLHQVGKDVPVKLFVRLVGEGGERVMVRIGGGWADLGEYLKEYASHHGRRSGSDGRFEIQGLPQSPSMTPTSVLAGNSSPAVSPASKPDSSLGGAGPFVARRRSGHSASSSFDLDAPMTPDNATYRHFESTPGSVDSNPSLLHPTSRPSSTDDDPPLGLAGPTTRRKDVSPSKQAWVDGMVEQARKASTEKKKGQDGGDFGDLGKVGATKRVFMKTQRDV